MANTIRKTEAGILEQNRVALSNVKKQPLIASEMAELGYGAEKIAEGEQILSETRAAYDFKKQEEIETIEASVKITTEDIATELAQIQTLETARTTYLREVGESQDATKQKDAAFAKMDDWMQDFYAIADIALEGQPQLIEALARKRKS